MQYLSRRRFLGALRLVACSVGFWSAANSRVFAQVFPQTFSSFAVDVSALKEKGLGPFADLVAAATLEELTRAFADRIDRRGPRLMVRLTGIFLTPFPDGGGGDRRFQGGGGGTDSLEGEALAVGPRGEILARHPQLAVRPVNTSILTPNEPGRAVEVARFYVQWLRRQLIS
ncbi:hypothetical protein [Microvirga terricola]|uniref:Uncharacterized protein n=1 Tax=Microvirga terricola TaxID=2719797 RepID=A0ABX0V9F5_9HYPH|nr:hypothetical protein [Microvirga terricola]NIX76312.1 hypothetical protein [Microvirga terricola]